MENKEIKSFLRTCEKDMKKTKEELEKSLKETNPICDYVFYSYKIVIIDEVLQMFKSNKGGVGFWAKAYKDINRPLSKIFTDIISLYTEPKLVTENKLYRVLDKKGFGIKGVV